ncbi:hypothetical protein Mgra_00002606 [Meloidogyne graminicola]|uniref:Uncharacterized protein n=1 Tax=Meloidogyne graminicola TaxID=189291 RepID=A0A8S9ZX96_9BILA|nr:hypothetical protein Mgra_00002606 [Meloidogyne graminicola]
MSSNKIKGKTNKNNQNYGSSSSDEAEHVNEICSGGWPSSVSVLETPDRKRVRNSLRSNNKQKNIYSINLIPDISFHPSTTTTSTTLTTHISFASTSTIITNTLANSPPINRLLNNSSSSFCSPTLRTPRQKSTITTTIHLSRSPLRSFFIKEKLQISPNNYISTTNKDQALRPLNLQNYIGIHNEDNNNIDQISTNQQKSVYPQSSFNLERRSIDENLENNEKQKKNSFEQRRVSKDSGFSENSNEINSNNDKSSYSHLSFTQSGLIETPSKGLLLSSGHSTSVVQPLFHSTPLNSPIPPLPFSFDSINNNQPSTSSFHSPIQEQNYGPFESTIFDDILNDLDKLQPEIPIKQQTPKKYQTRSVKFERRLLSLKWRRESPRKKANSLVEWQKIEENKIPSNLFIEGINNENLQEISVLVFSQKIVN